MSSPPLLALSITYWLHMLATVAWLGGLAALSILVLPSAQVSLESDAYSRLLEAIQRRLDPLGWLCLAILVGTGLFQMSASPNYQGFLAINNRWAVAILTKHLVFFAMTGLSAYLTWGVLPALRRAALRQARQEQASHTQARQTQARQMADDIQMHANAANAELQRLKSREALLLRLNLFLGVIILALTAIARAS
jgi:uncharacterized membrane protein